MPKIERKTIFDIANVIGNIKTDLIFKKPPKKTKNSTDDCKECKHNVEILSS